MPDEVLSDRVAGSDAGVLLRSRIPISLVAERLVVEAAREEGFRLGDVKVRAVGDDDVLLERMEKARRALDRAVERWRQETAPWTRLDFALEHQEHTQWCWAAVSVSVSLYYEARADWTQCAMVNQELDRTDCCRNGSIRECNRPHPLDPALNRAEVLDRMERGSIPFDAVGHEIDAGRPIAWRIHWRGGGGHFAVIEAYGQAADEWVTVDDPWIGQSDLPIVTLTGGDYQGGGSWTHTYFTRRQPPEPFGRSVSRELRLAREVWERITAEELGEPAMDGER